MAASAGLFFAAISETVLSKQAEKYYPGFCYSPDDFCWPCFSRFPPQLGSSAFLGRSHQAFGDGDSEEMVGGGEGGRAQGTRQRCWRRQTWQSGDREMGLAAGLPRGIREAARRGVLQGPVGVFGAGGEL